MSVQVFYKNKAKLSSPGVIALFGNEKFQIKNLKSSFSKSEALYIEKILKNKNYTKENIISFNINEKTTVILISIKKNLKGSDVEALGAQLFNFVKKDKIKNLSIYSENIDIKPGKDFIGRFRLFLKLHLYIFFFS